jgi:hypothetical protein
MSSVVETSLAICCEALRNQLSKCFLGLFLWFYAGLGLFEAIISPKMATMKRFLNTVYWIGLAASLALISFGVWCHFTMDAIVRLPFVLLSVSAPLMIGFYCVEHLLRQGSETDTMKMRALQGIRQAGALALQIFKAVATAFVSRDKSPKRASC